MWARRGSAATSRRRATSRSSHGSPAPAEAASRHGAPAGPCRSRTWPTRTARVYGSIAIRAIERERMRLQRRRFTEPTDVRRFPARPGRRRRAGRSRRRPDGLRARLALVGRRQADRRHGSVPVPPPRVHRSQGGFGRRCPTGPSSRSGPATSSRSRRATTPGSSATSPGCRVDFEAMRTYGKKLDAEAERTLASIVITDIVDSTQLRRARWAPRAGATSSPSTTARRPPRSTGIAAGSSRRPATGSSPPSTGAERAVRAAASIRGDGERAATCEVRAGVHSGEVQVTADDVRGIAVHTAARIMAAARAGRNPRLGDGHGPRRRLRARVRGRGPARAQGPCRQAPAVPARG